MEGIDILTIEDGMKKEEDESYQWVSQPFNEKLSEPALKTMDREIYLCMAGIPPTPPLA